jgi:hypothetical protein
MIFTIEKMVPRTGSEPSTPACFRHCRPWADRFGSVMIFTIEKIGASNRNRTGTPAMNEAADFKSAVSTYFTIEAVSVAAS